MFTAEVKVTLKPIVSDPQGLTVKHALENLGHENVNKVRIGKLIVLTLEAKDIETAKVEVEEMCKELLSNLIIEKYSFDIRKK